MSDKSKKKIKISVIHARSYEPPPGRDFETAMAYVNSNIDKTIGYIEEAGKSGADIVCTHEDFTNVCAYCRDFTNPDLFYTVAAAIKEPLRNRISALAKQYSMLIATNNMDWVEGKIYNTSTIYGRDGEIVGQYKKVHLADSENWKVTPGTEFNVIKTDIGNIGFCTCYDMIFPETCRILALNGADIIIHQTQGWGTGSKASPKVGESYMRVRAAENSVYMVVAKNIQGDGSDGGRSVIVDNYGDMLAESEVTTEGILSYELEPDYHLLAPYQFNNFFAGVPGCKGRQLMARKPSCYSPLTDPKPVVKEIFHDYKLLHSLEEGKAQMEAWEALPAEEKSKFYW
ncbi:MAG: carbon-nitrogen hydrolase family protein [Defluviitaleaceae bacterium]|nr:carbon-nitrogen hydrolase family protein [Defluviitaleaceae bacterium]